MSNNQLDKIALALNNGYRTKQNGDRVYLDARVRRIYETTLRAARARLGIVSWPAHYGTVRRMGNDYIPEREYRQRFSTQKAS